VEFLKGNHELAAKFDEVEDKCPTVKSKIVISKPKEDWLFYDEVVECEK